MLEARNLTVSIPTEDGTIHAVQNVSFAIEAGELFGIAGESGSGKSVMMQAILGLLPYADITGEVLFEGRDLLRENPRGLRKLRGSRIGMIFQDPLSSLHPYYTIGSQITEAIHAHEKVSKPAARARAIEMLAKVGIANADERFHAYPHQFSGGMRQRVMIAMALVLNPALIIADEPTTALDVTVQAQIVALLDTMRKELGTTVIMITHDLGLLSSVADRVMVMYAGNRMEYGASDAVFTTPAHPYTAGLLRSSPANYAAGEELIAIPGRPPSLLHMPEGCAFAPRCSAVMDKCHTRRPPLRRYSDKVEALCWLEDTAPAPAQRAISTDRRADTQTAPVVLRIEDVALSFATGGLFDKKGRFEVLKGINLEVRRGETLGLVGESGCGKSTLARVIAGLIPATSGRVLLGDADMAHLDAAGWRETRKAVQLVFQDPFGSLNPRRRVGAIIGDPFRIHHVASGAGRKARVQELMERVGLNPEHYNRFPSEFSGGQRQRIGIARALALNPGLIIFDEPVSALDVSIQAQVLNLMSKLQRELGLTYLFISHDLAVVRQICNRIAVMNKGRIVELADAEAIYANPQDEYTRTLLAASVTPPPQHAARGRDLVRTIDWVAA
ncbi:dipeptide ABC transporter ATP-binding protein [Devosia yakushimensis]|uniref:dipeptide ABC transporter ATP-binding protein n=1 Tax=Devosia yakushimensis TaxID=470028 RepID=UPI0024E10296|nr:ABC transporter ATP-binding protein [Devosia yakushimensis]